MHFELLLAAVNLAIMKQVLTLEVPGTGVEAAELAIGLVSGHHCPFCVEKIHAILGHKNVKYANVNKKTKPKPKRNLCI